MYISQGNRPTILLCLAAGNGGSRSNKVPKRGSQAGVVMSPGSHGVSNLYLADGKDGGRTRGYRHNFSNAPHNLHCCWRLNCGLVSQGALGQAC